MKDNADPRRIHSAVCVTVQMTLAAQASSAAKAHDGKHHFAALHSGNRSNNCCFRASSQAALQGLCK